MIKSNLSKIGRSRLAQLSVAGVVGGSLIVACSPSRLQRTALVERVSEVQAKQLATDGKATESAEMYARIGELLILPEGFGYADQMFDKALSIDPNNAKANFYSALVKPLMVAQGFMPRIEKILDANSNAALLKLKARFAELNAPELVDFATKIPAGKKPLESYHDVQRVALTEMIPALVSSVEKLSRIDTTKPVELRINLGRFGFPSESWTHEETNCKNDYSYVIDGQTSQYVWENGSYSIKGKQKGSLSYWSCDYSMMSLGFNPPKATTYLVDGVDVKALKGTFLASISYLRAITAYSAKDLDVIQKRIEALKISRGMNGYVSYWSNSSSGDYFSHAVSKQGEITPKEQIEIVREFPDFGTLEPDNQLAELSKSGQDSLKDLIELDQLSQDVCYNPVRQGSQSLIKQVCMDYGTMESVRLISDLLAAPKKVKIGGGSVEILVNLQSFLKNPPKDLKDFLPNQFDKKGNITGLPNSSVGGLFPDNNLELKLKEAGSIQ